ncbi:hypothetical protein BSKO_10405 [Bryopsis sp. KO-2023]|nr:hypothetical protein BSKO_10405 [Bryopsis sp. KO-2023]
MEPAPAEVPKVEYFDVLEGEVKTELDGTGSTPEGGVTLDHMDCTLNFVLSEDRLGGRSLSEGGMAYMWSGARATLGVVGGRYYFKCKIVKTLPAEVSSTPDVDASHSCRIGVSWRSSEVFLLGETATSWGYDGAGEVLHAGKLSAYGQPFGPDDEIVCLVDLESGKPAVSFVKNGETLGVAFELDVSGEGEVGALFPHVLVKNMEVALDFGGAGVESEGVLQGYQPWEYALIDPTRVNMAPRQTVPFSDCEVLMLVGLPGSGKTSWALDHVKKHPEKRYIILGNSLVEEHMRIPEKKKQNMLTRFGHLETLVTEVFNELLDRATAYPRNYILDQTNVYANARVRKLKPFMLAGFRRKAVVFVIPDEVLFRRQQKQHVEEGKFVPDQEIAEMKANFNPPVIGKFPNFDEVTYVARKPPESQAIIEEQRKSSRAWLVHNRKRALGQEVGDIPKRLLNETPMNEISRFKGGMTGIKGIDLRSSAVGNVPGGIGPLRLQVVPGGLLQGMGGIPSVTGNRSLVALQTGGRQRPIQSLPVVNGIQGPINVIVPSASTAGAGTGGVQLPMIRTNLSSQRISGPTPMEKPHPGSARSCGGKATGSNAIPVGLRKPSAVTVRHPMATSVLHETQGFQDGKIDIRQKAGVGVSVGGIGLEALGGGGLGSDGNMLFAGGVNFDANGGQMLPTIGRSSDGRQHSGSSYQTDLRIIEDGSMVNQLPMNFQNKKQRTMGMFGNQGSAADLALKARNIVQGGSDKLVASLHPMARVTPGVGMPTRPAAQTQQVPLHQPPPPPRVALGAGNSSQVRTPFTVNGLTVIPPAHVSQRSQTIGLEDNLRQHRMSYVGQNGGSVSQVIENAGDARRGSGPVVGAPPQQVSSSTMPPLITAYQSTAHHQDTQKQQQQQISTYKHPAQFNSVQNRQQPSSGQYGHYVSEVGTANQHQTYSQAPNQTQGVRGSSVQEQHNPGYSTPSSQPLGFQHQYHQGYRGLGARQGVDYHTAIPGQKDIAAPVPSNPRAGHNLSHLPAASVEYPASVQSKPAHGGAYEHYSNQANGQLGSTSANVVSQAQLYAHGGEDPYGQGSAQYRSVNQYGAFPGGQYHGQVAGGNGVQPAVSQTYSLPGQKGFGQGGNEQQYQQQQPQQYGQVTPNQTYPKTQAYVQQNGAAVGNYSQSGQAYVQPGGVQQQYGHAGYQYPNPGEDRSYGGGNAAAQAGQTDQYPQQHSYGQTAGQQYAQGQAGQAYGTGAEGYNYPYGTYDPSWNGYGYDANAYASANQASYQYSNQDYRQ